MVLVQQRHINIVLIGHVNSRELTIAEHLMHKWCDIDKYTVSKFEKRLLRCIKVLLRIIVEQPIEWNSSLYIKVFDNMDRRTLWSLLRHYDVAEIFNIVRNSCYGLHCKVMED